MNTSFKIRAQAKSKGETIKSKTKERSSGSKKKPRKASGDTKSKGSNGQPLASNGAAQPAEKVVYEPEAAGEDDHAFFDDEENADYAKFMLALDSSELPTFSKRAKDGVAVRHISKKKARQSKATAAAQAGTPSAPTPPISTEGEKYAATDAVPATIEGMISAAAIKPTPSATARKEAVVDAKRRKASTAGWAVEEGGPERLPIKTRRGLLKPNERMQHSAPVPSAVANEKKDNATPAAGGSNGVATADGSESQPAANVAEAVTDERANGDTMSDSDGSGSVYDSADSDVEDYAMGEFDGHDNIPRTTVAAGGGKVDLAVLKQRRFAQKKAQIAELCESILGAPEESLMRPKTVQKGEDDRSRMEQLFAMVRCAVATLSCHACHDAGTLRTVVLQ